MQSSFIPLMVPDLRDEDIESVVNVLKSGMLVQGKNVEELERKTASYLGCKHAVAVSNGTATMHICLKILGIGPGDEVIVPAFSYVATANVVELVGAKPVFVDIDQHSFNIDSRKIEALINKNTKAIIPVHEFGLAADMDAILVIAEKYSLYVIEDAACALGAKEIDRFVGTRGLFGSFSFHPRKAITSGEGGVITTNDDELARKCRIIRNHGIEILNGKMEFVDAGFNYRMTEMQAALVLSQFSRIESILETRNGLANIYYRELKNQSKLILPCIPSNKKHTFQTFHILLDQNINRDQFIDKLGVKGVGSNYGAQCIPDQVFYRNKYNLDSNKLFPNAYRAYKQGLALPLYEKLSEKDIMHVSSVVKELLHD